MILLSQAFLTLLLAPQQQPAPAANFDQLLSDTIANARAFDTRLPNFICKQTTRRFVAQAAGSANAWKSVDWNEQEITYFERKEARKLLSINGKAVDPRKQAEGLRRSGLQAQSMFAGMFSQIFRDESHTAYRYERTEADGTVVIHYQIERVNSSWTITRGGRRWTRGYSGQIWVDPATRSILRVFARFQPELGDPDWLGKSTTELHYGFVKVADEEKVLLPVRSEVQVEVSPKNVRRNVIEFSDFRQYKAESKIEF